MPSKSKVYFFFAHTQIALKDRTKLKMMIRKIFRLEKRDLCSLSYIFCSDKALLKINHQYLQHDFYTDIITFNYSGNKEKIIGEIYISIDRVKDNAQRLNESFKSELHRVIFHGALHLCGYKDGTIKEREKMRSKEDMYLKSYLR
ncbi:MAG TPA: rRNA maturation RNase YbeY [Chitinophagaceae bacterium]|nr:rRNA maturation RNase YbeY [Chitinophagaceae bacterium]